MLESTVSLNSDPHSRARFVTLTAAITLLALLLRVLYLWTAQVDFPIRGDALGYWTYAWNLATHGTFSSSPPEAATTVPDTFRGPGYPLFLAICMKLAAAPEDALGLAQAAQILVGCALVPLTIALARFWLSRPTALLVGLLVALWPHLIVFSSTLLSETLFAFMLLSLVVTACAAQLRNNRALGFCSGLLAGLAYLVNPVVMLFPPAMVVLLAWRHQARVGLSLLLGFALVAGAWGLRNANLQDSSGSGQRASMNLVEGSWPRYHDAHNDESINEYARSVADAIREEEQLMFRDPRAGFNSMLSRFRGDPSYYLKWYFLQKPYLLWDWRIRIGWGDIYFAETYNSPFERNAALRAMHALFRWANPFLFGLAMLGSLACLARGARHEAEPFAQVMVAIFFIYITGVHTVFQAEPRYSIAYRPFEILLAVSTLAAVMGWLMGRMRSRSSSDSNR